MILENWFDYAANILPVLTLIGFFWRSMEKKFEKIEYRFDKIDHRFDKIERDIGDIKERLTFLEAQTIMFNAIPEENARSTGAKKMWERRKAHQIKKLEEK